MSGAAPAAPADPTAPAIAAVRPARRVSGAMIVALVIVGGWIVVAIAAPMIAPYDPDAIDIRNLLAPPGAAHWFGADQVGRDVFSRVLYRLPRRPLAVRGRRGSAAADRYQRRPVHGGQLQRGQA